MRREQLDRAMSSAGQQDDKIGNRTARVALRVEAMCLPMWVLDLPVDYARTRHCARSSRLGSGTASTDLTTCRVVVSLNALSTLRWR